MNSVTNILQQTSETLFSFEVLPPLRGKSIEQIYSTIDRLMAFHPAFIEVTTHRSASSRSMECLSSLMSFVVVILSKKQSTSCSTSRSST